MNRQEHWQKIYGERSPDEVSWYQREPSISLSLIAATGVGLTDPIIDVGGGASRLVDQLLDGGFHDVTVLDISAEALRHSRQRLGQRADIPHWIESDVTGFKADRQYSVWHDRATFHFLVDKADRAKYVLALRHALGPGGHVIIAAFAIGGPEKCSGLDIVQYDAEKLLAELGSEFRLIEELRETHTTPGGGNQEFAWFLLKRKETEAQ